MRVVFYLSFVAVFASFAIADSTPVVSVSTEAPRALTAGQECRTRLVFMVREGFHIQANPVAAKNLIPAKLNLKAASGVKSLPPFYPPSRPYRLKGSSKDLAVYSGTFEIVIPLKASKSAKPGSRALQGSFRYQACDDATCLFPETIPVVIAMEVAPYSSTSPSGLAASNLPLPCPAFRK